MRKRKILALISIAVFCCGLLLGLASCEPLPIFTGVTVCGVTLNGISEVELNSVDFKFNIIDYPDTRAETVNVNSFVLATYDMSNATSRDVVVPLYLLVESPRYEYSDFDIVSSCKQYNFTTTAMQEILLRCVYNQVFNYYDADNATKVADILKNLHDEKQVDSYYNDALPVYKYTYAIVNVSDKATSVRYTQTKGDDGMLFFENEIIRTNDSFMSSYIYYDIDIDDTDTLTFYSVGKEFNRIDLFSVVGGDVTYLSREQVSFDELAMSYYDEESDISKVDWYNAVFASINNIKPTNLANAYNINFFDMTGKLSYMYQCNLTVPAQSDVSLEVEMPLYPTINCDDYTVNVYEYVMNPSGLSNWRGTPDISVSVITEGYYVDSSLQLKQTSTGYDVLNVDSKMSDFFFTLSRTPNFESSTAASERTERRIVAILGIIVGLCYLVPIVTVSVVLGCDKAKRNRKKKAQVDDITTTTQL